MKFCISIFILVLGLAGKVALAAVTQGRPVTYLNLRAFCKRAGCEVLHNWEKQKVIVQNPRYGKQAVLSPVVKIALYDGFWDFGDVLSTPNGYRISEPTAELLTQYLLLKPSTGVAAEAIEDAGRHDLKIIIIDPGHGGHDFGTSSKSHKEKDISLIYAMALKERLETEMPEVKIHLTRTQDRFVSLPERARLANRQKGGLFISIHVNHADDVKISGAETFILSPEATDHDSKKTALAENKEWLTHSTGVTSVSTDLNKIFVDLEQQKFIQRSALFAAYVQQELGRIERGAVVKDRGVKQAFFYVLSQVAMPSVLMEMGFLSNKNDRERLMNLQFRDTFTRSVVTALKRYRMKGGL